MPREANEQNLPDRFGHVYKQSVYLKKWNKRLFAIKGGALCYYKDVPAQGRPGRLDNSFFGSHLNRRNQIIIKLHV